MTVWQFMAAFDGYVKHNSAGDNKMDDAEAAELFDWLQSKD
jgi:hypothetical protein